MVKIYTQNDTAKRNVQTCNSTFVFFDHFCKCFTLRLLVMICLNKLPKSLEYSSKLSSELSSEPLGYSNCWNAPSKTDPSNCPNLNIKKKMSFFFFCYPKKLDKSEVGPILFLWNNTRQYIFLSNLSFSNWNCYQLLLIFNSVGSVSFVVSIHTHSMSFTSQSLFETMGEFFQKIPFSRCCHHQILLLHNH